MVLSQSSSPFVFRPLVPNPERWVAPDVSSFSLSIVPDSGLTSPVQARKKTTTEAAMTVVINFFIFNKFSTKIKTVFSFVLTGIPVKNTANVELMVFAEICIMISVIYQRGLRLNDYTICIVNKLKHTMKGIMSFIAASAATVCKTTETPSNNV